MSHLCDSTVAGPTARRDNALASKYEYSPFRYPPLKSALLNSQYQFAVHSESFFFQNQDEKGVSVAMFFFMINYMYQTKLT